MKINRDYYLQRNQDTKQAVPVLSPVHEEKKKEYNGRIKKLQSQIKSQQKKNQKFRDNAQTILRIIQESVQEHKEKVLLELKILQAEVISFCEDRNNSDEHSSLLLDIVLDSYESLSLAPELPEWCFYNPPRPWGKPVQMTEREKDSTHSKPTEKDQRKVDRAVESRRKKAESERRLWSGRSLLGPSEEKSLRELRAAYIRLARAVHPDRVEDPTQRELATSFMKRVNSAYSNRDAKALFDLEQELAIYPFGKLKSPNLSGEFESRVSLLSSQLEVLKKEFVKLKKSNLGQAIESYEHAIKRGYLVIEFAAPQLPTLKRELKELFSRLNEAINQNSKKKSFFSWLKRHYFTAADPFEGFES